MGYTLKLKYSDGSLNARGGDSDPHLILIRDGQIFWDKIFITFVFLIKILDKH